MRVGQTKRRTRQFLSLAARIGFCLEMQPRQAREQFPLGQHGRTRTNVWEYTAGSVKAATGKGDHPTPKPVGLIGDAIRDCSRRGDLILDPFRGGGTILIAAERTGRAARAIEIDPCYCDLAIRPWQARTGRSAIHVDSGASFADRERGM